MRKKGVLMFGACACILLLGACSAGQLKPEEHMQDLLDNMNSNSYDFKGELHAQVGEDTLEELLTLDGFYVANKGYRLHANVALPEFETSSDVLSADDQLYYKLPKSDKWKLTTDQDLRMLGITYKDSPSDMFQGMKEMVQSIEPTDKDNVFKITLDRDEYRKKAGDNTIMRLPQVDIQGRDFQLELLQNPVADVEVDFDHNVIRSVTLSYMVKSTLTGNKAQPMNVTYQMYMDQFNQDQKLPDVTS